jgi:hypothetical protein
MEIVTAVILISYEKYLEKIPVRILIYISKLSILIGYSFYIFSPCFTRDQRIMVILIALSVIFFYKVGKFVESPIFREFERTGIYRSNSQFILDIDSSDEDSDEEDSQINEILIPADAG